MSVLNIVLIIAAAALITGLLIYYLFFGRKAIKQQKEQDEFIKDAKETIDMLVIDKKKMPLRDSGLPKIVLDQSPKRYHKRKFRIVKAKIGPRIFSLIADKEIFDDIPVKTNIRADVSGVYLTAFRPLKPLKGEAAEAAAARKKKKKKRN